MSLRVETVILGPDSQQYAGEGQRKHSVGRIAEAVREAEELGFDCVTAPEAGHDPFLPLAIAAEHSQRVTLATNVAIAFPRSPMVTAQIAWDLQQLSGGRFQLGLGTQVKGHNQRRYSTAWTGKPVARLREYIECMRAMFATFRSGKTVKYDGEHYQFSLMSPFFNPGDIDYPDLPIYIGGFKPASCRLAGELCQGIRVHPIATFEFVEKVVRPAIAEGASKAASTESKLGIDIVGSPFLAIGADDEGVEKAKNALRQQIAFYASTRTYHSVLELHGWLETGLRLHQMSVEGKWAQMPALISDDMLEQWAVIATRDELATKLNERCAGIFSSVLLDLPAEARRDRDWVGEIVAALH